VPPFFSPSISLRWFLPHPGTSGPLTRGLRPAQGPLETGSRSEDAGFRAVARLDPRIWRGGRAAGGRPRRTPRPLRGGELPGIGPARDRVGALAGEDARQRPSEEQDSSDLTNAQSSVDRGRRKVSASTGGRQRYRMFHLHPTLPRAPTTSRHASDTARQGHRRPVRSVRGGGLSCLRGDHAAPSADYARLTTVPAARAGARRSSFVLGVPAFDCGSPSRRRGVCARGETARVRGDSSALHALSCRGWCTTRLTAWVCR
jgi:hypothetical protein